MLIRPSPCRAQSLKLAHSVVADTKARSHYAIVKTKAVTSSGWEYMIVHMERACLGVYHAMAYVGSAFQEAYPRGRSAVSSDCPAHRSCLAKTGRACTG